MGKRINRGGQKWANPLTQQKATFPLPFQPIHLDAIDTTSDTQTDYFVPFPQTLHNPVPCMQDTRPKPLPVFAQFLLVCGPCQVLCYLGRPARRTSVHYAKYATERSVRVHCAISVLPEY